MASNTTVTSSVFGPYNLANKDLLDISNLLIKEFEEGLSKPEHKSPIKMLVTYVHRLPTGKEHGRYFALDLGGSNFRVLLITIDENGGVHQEVEKLALTKEIMESNQEVLFDSIADSLINFAKKHNVTSPLPLGFTFSFPVFQTAINRGTLIRWTKGFSAEGAVDKDVVELLTAALSRKNSNIANICALVNDTTGTLITRAVTHKDCYIGLILGTGTNACYLEELSKVPKYTTPPPKSTHVIINTEWGAFGENGALDKYLTEEDHELDKAALHQKEQIFEKMISGKYIGELVQLLILQLVSQGLLFGGIPSIRIIEPGTFVASHVSMIESGEAPNLPEIKKILSEFDLTPTDEDCLLVRQACAAVTGRAARLAAAGIVALVKKIGKEQGCTVGVDGTLFKMHPKFRKLMETTLNELIPNHKIRIEESEDGSGVGAAVIAAISINP